MEGKSKEGARKLQVVADASAAEQDRPPSPPPSLAVCSWSSSRGGPLCSHRMPKVTPLWEAQPYLPVQPTLWVILGGWGLLSAGKPPVASLPGSFHGWDPSESYCEGQGRSQGTSGLRLSKEGAWREVSRWGCKDPASGKAGWVRGSSCPSPCPRAAR